MSDWIKGAIKRPGALSQKACGKKKCPPGAVSSYCSGKHTGRTAKQCNLARTLKGLGKKPRKGKRKQS